MSKGGRYSSRGGHGSHGSGNGILIALIVVAVLLLVLVAGLLGFLFLNNNASLQVPTTVPTTAPVQTQAPTMETTAVTTEATTEPTTVPTTLPYKESGLDIINILVVGQAARDGEESRIADTMILATVNKNTKTLTLTSFLRDTFAMLPNPKDLNSNYGRQRINLAYHLGWKAGGTALAMDTVNRCLYINFGINVDYDIEVDFRAVIDLINLIGGVTIDLTEAEAEYLLNDDKVWQEDIHAGSCWLDGDTALAYARMRKAAGDSDSDIKRTSRQRNMIQAILNQVKGLGFTKLQELANAALPMITTNMTNDEITTCIWEILPLLPELKVETGTCPVETTYWGEVIELDGYPASVLKFDEGQNKKLMMPITEGTTN